METNCKIWKLAKSATARKCGLESTFEILKDFKDLKDFEEGKASAKGGACFFSILQGIICLSALAERLTAYAGASALPSRT